MEDGHVLPGLMHKVYNAKRESLVNAVLGSSKVVSMFKRYSSILFLLVLFQSQFL